jgi:hypothetical protein
MSHQMQRKTYVRKNPASVVSSTKKPWIDSVTLLSEVYREYAMTLLRLSDPAFPIERRSRERWEATSSKLRETELSRGVQP